MGTGMDTEEKQRVERLLKRLETLIQGGLNEKQDSSTPVTTAGN